MNPLIMLYTPSKINPVLLSLVVTLWACATAIRRRRLGLSPGLAENVGIRNALPANPQSADLNTCQCGNHGNQASSVDRRQRQLNKTRPECWRYRLCTEHRLPGRARVRRLMDRY